MKTKLNKIVIGIAMLSILMPNVSFSQSTDGLKSVILPAKNRGYLNWVGDGSPKYKIEIFELVNDEYILLSSKITEDNYTKMSPVLFTLPNVSYRISSMNADETIVTVGDVIPNDVPVNPGGLEEICTIKCNGRSYAWSLRNWQKTVSDGEGGQIPTSKIVEFNGAVKDYDPNTGIEVPYYQAFSTVAWNALPNNHPYKRITNNNGIGNEPNQYLYDQFDITPGLGGGPFYDKNNVQINEGVAVAKKMDQFDPMRHWLTPENVDPNLICLAPISGSGSWVNFFNQHGEGTLGSGVTSDWETYFPTTSEIYCVSSGSMGGGGLTPGNFGHTVVDAIDFFECLQSATSTTNEGTTYTTLLPCLSNFIIASGNNDNLVSGIAFKSILDNSTNVQFTNDNGRVKLLTERKDAKFDKGLYYCNIYNENEGIVPSVIEFMADVKALEASELVTLLIAPNPVVTTKLEFQVSTVEEVPTQVRVYNLSGELVYSASETVSQDNDLFISIDISNVSTPYNQLRVSLIFEDGSVIQQTALIEN